MQQPLQIEKCSPFCPECGSYLIFRDNECICKNPQCGWHCQECSNDDDI
ncbi:MAG: hypothetical protein ACOX8S_04185 [Christensenellales bacterium]|jgi:hypothetical protein